MSDENDKVKVAEYGSWSSPITSEIAVQGVPCVSEIHTHQNANNEGIDTESVSQAAFHVNLTPKGGQVERQPRLLQTPPDFSFSH
jgi:hypothetical protein